MEPVEAVVLPQGKNNENNDSDCFLWRGRHGGLLVSALDSGSGRSGLGTGWGSALCSWARHFIHILVIIQSESEDSIQLTSDQIKSA